MNILFKSSLKNFKYKITYKYFIKFKQKLFLVKHASNLSSKIIFFAKKYSHSVLSKNAVEN